MTRRITRRFRLALLFLAMFLSLPPATMGAASANSVTQAPTVATNPAQAAAAPQGIVCDRPRDSHGYYTGNARCPVRSGSWTYYQAYLEYFDDCSQTQRTTSTIRMQILARRGSTAVIIGGVWVVAVETSKRFGSMRFNAIDGYIRLHDGAWNYNGNFSHDIADLYTGDPIRYGVSPNNPVGLVPNGSQNPYFEGQYAMANHPDPYFHADCRLIPLSVVFTK